MNHDWKQTYSKSSPYARFMIRAELYKLALLAGILIALLW